MATVALRAEVIVWSTRLFRCLIQGRQVDVPSHCVESGTTVSRSGDRGIVVVPTWCAAVLGLTESQR
jgi:hypothetical protein